MTPKVLLDSITSTRKLEHQVLTPISSSSSSSSSNNNNNNNYHLHHKHFIIYNDKDMSYLLSAPTTESDAVSLIFSALGSTENLAQASKNCMEGDNKHEDIRSSVDITIETSSLICSPEEQLSPIPRIYIALPDILYTNDQQSIIVPNRIPLRNAPPVNKSLLKANGSRESRPDYRYSMSSDS